MRVAVVGLGTMGAPIARHLIEAGNEVTVHNRTREREGPLVEAGAQAAASPAEAARGAEVVVTCVSDTPDLEQVLLGGGGAVEGLEPGAIVVDCSTVAPRATRRLAETLAERGIGFVDAPLSGGSEGAEQGILTVFVGGEREHVDRVQPLLESFGKTITHLGPAGAGQAAKAVNQVVIAGIYAGLAEGIALAEAEGLPADALLAALAGGSARSWVLEHRARNMVDDHYPLGFRVVLHRKDLRIALDEARELGLELPLTALVADLEDRLVDDGHGDEDVSALARALKRPD